MPVLFLCNWNAMTRTLQFALKMTGRGLTPRYWMSLNLMKTAVSGLLGMKERVELLGSALFQLNLRLVQAPVGLKLPNDLQGVT